MYAHTIQHVSIYAPLRAKHSNTSPSVEMCLFAMPRWAFTLCPPNFSFNDGSKSILRPCAFLRNMKLELWNLFREDVRDLFELTTSNMNTYMAAWLWGA